MVDGAPEQMPAEQQPENRGLTVSISPSLFEELKTYLEFDQHDEDILQHIEEVLEPHFGHIIAHLYTSMEEQPAARTAMQESGTDSRRIQNLIHDWMRGLLRGPYDESYFNERIRMGVTFVQLRMPQHFMVCAVNMVRSALYEEVRKLKLENEADHLHSIHKVIDLEIGITMEAFREGYAERVRQSERQALQERIEESEHLAYVGQLASTLAHEIKNPLAGISGAVQVITSSMHDRDPNREIASEILMQIDRMDTTVRDLLVYARPIHPVKMPHCLSQLIKRTLVLLQQGPLQEMEIDTNDVEPTMSVAVDETQLQQVLTNLLLNATHACDGNGTITIRTQRRDQMVRVEIGDDGKGIPREEIPRVFEPFFTTKARGSGLGLSICKRIVEAHEGRIAVQSRPGKGTKMIIELPGEE